MAFTQTHKTTIVRPGSDDLIETTQHSEGAQNNLDETITDGSNDAVAWAVDVSAIAALCIVVDGPCTIKTNSSSEPDNTLTFAAAGKYEWKNSGLSTEEVCLLDADVTSLFVTTTGAVRVQIACIVDPTPA